MADAKITALTALTTPAVEDVIPIVDDVAGTPITKKSTLQVIADLFAGLTQTLIGKTLTAPLFQGEIDGWVLANETWTYNNGFGINVPSGAATRYFKSDKIRYKQGGAYKYGYITNVADTLLTVTGGVEYPVSDAAITNNYYSRASNPAGFPHRFSFNFSWEGWSSLSVLTFVFSLSNNIATAEYEVIGTSDQTYARITLPIITAAISSSTGYLSFSNIVGYAVDNTVGRTTPAKAEVTQNGANPSKIDFYTDWVIAGWTASGTKRMKGCISWII